MLDLLPALVTLIFLGMVLGLALSPTGKAGQLRRRRFSARSGPGLASMLAVAGLAALLIEAASWPALAKFSWAPGLLVGGAVLTLIAIATNRSWWEIVSTAVGILLLVATMGVSGALQLVVITALLVWLFNWIRSLLA